MREQGEKEAARQEGKAEIVKNMLLAGMSVEAIVGFTGLTREEVEMLNENA